MTLSTNYWINVCLLKKNSLVDLECHVNIAEQL